MRARGVFLPAVSLFLLMALAAPAGAAPVRTELVSRYQGIDMIEGNSSTFGGHVLSENGRFVVFTVNDDDLPGADGTRDVYVRDRARDRTRLVSRNPARDPAESSSDDAPSISDNGRFVAFSTSANNMPGADSTEDVFVLDLQTGRTRLVSKTSAGAPADGNSASPSMSANGRFVAFSSSANNLPGQDGIASVYVHDRKTGKTRLVSKTSGGTPANGDSRRPSLSADGQRVSFYSSASNLPGSMTYNDVFVWDMETKRLRLVSRTSSGDVLSNASFSTAGALSANGRFVAFESAAEELPGGTNSYYHIYVHDLATRRTRLVSKRPSGTPADDESNEAAISGGGRYVVFESRANNLGGDPDHINVFVHDRENGRTRLVSRATSGEAGDQDSFYPSISADGRFAGFTSRATNFSAADADLYSDVFVRGPLP